MPGLSPKWTFNMAATTKWRISPWTARLSNRGDRSLKSQTATSVILSEDLKFLDVWHGNFSWTFPGYLFAVSFAGAAARLFETAGPISCLVLPPVGVVWYLYKLYRDKEDAEKEHAIELIDLNERVISRLAMAIEAKDRFTQIHVERVREYAVAIAAELKLNEPEMEAVKIGAMVHDIGKIAVPKTTLPSLAS